LDNSAGRGSSGAAATSARGQIIGYALILGIFLSLLIVALVSSWLAVELVNETRAYATGEGRYSKAQKMAVLDLYRYADTNDQKYYDAFQRDIAVPRGDRAARMALMAEPPDVQAAAEGFLRGQNDPEDIHGLIRLYRWFYWWKPFVAATHDWRTADEKIDVLLVEAATLHRHVTQGTLTRPVRKSLIGRIEAIDAEITARETTFSTHMGEAARSATWLVVIGLGGLTIGLWTIGIFFATRLVRRQLALGNQLRESETRFRDYAEVASDWYWEMDADAKVTFLSERFEEIVGVKPETVLGMDVADVIRTWAVDTRHGKAAVTSIEARKPFRGLALRFIRDSGETSYCAISGKPNCDDDGAFAGYRGAGADITDDIHAAQNLRDAKERAEIANRSKSEFLANMSHELRTPLNAILGFSDVIHHRMFGDRAIERYSDYAKDIHSSGAHLLNIINDILDLSKIEAGRAVLDESEVALDAVFRETVMLLGDRIARGGASFHTVLPDVTVIVRIDMRKFTQVLVNLLSNALKFTPAGGSVTLSAARAKDGSVLVQVIDTGIGIAAMDIETVLAPFGQVESAFSRRHHGTGLGLPLAKSLAELHDGTLTVESVEGEGTTVTVSLPPERVVHHVVPMLAAG
jgi:PAS domain S-box-containing protein